MRTADIRMTVNVYGDVVTDEIQQAHSGLCFGGSEWGSNPPVTGKPAARRF
jgi:hypothetical protein